MYLPLMKKLNVLATYSIFDNLETMGGGYAVNEQQVILPSLVPRGAGAG